MKRKVGALVGYIMGPWPLTSLMTLTLDVSRSNFEIALSGIVALIDVKWKGSDLIWYWADCMTLPFDHTHDHDLGVSMSVWNSFISEMGRPIDMERKGFPICHWHALKRMSYTCNIDFNSVGNSTWRHHLHFTILCVWGGISLWILVNTSGISSM